jgi:hypothetical protein
MHCGKPLIEQHLWPLGQVVFPQAPPSLPIRQRPPLHVNPWQQSHLLEHEAFDWPQQRSPLRSQELGKAPQTTSSSG